MQLGIIEGFYGKPWAWEERTATVRFLAEHEYGFYMYAPKADVHLRRLWRERHPDDVAQQLARLSAVSRQSGVRFGIGLSPTKLHVQFDRGAQQALARKLEELTAIGVDFLALLFDDMRGDLPDLAQHQIEIVHWVAERTGAELFMCPSYYTDDPVLDRVFGQRPAGYLEALGRGLDAHVQMFWTGEEVCAREISVGHITRVAEQMRRKPFVWDNYPVNDGERMSQYLHVRAFTGRPAGLADVIAGHGVNPALQPYLSWVPALSLVQSYRLGAQYQYGAALLESATTAFGAEVAQLIYEDALILQDVGLDKLGDKEAYLRERYSRIDHPAAREVIAWLDGAYRITDEIVRSQVAEE